MTPGGSETITIHGDPGWRVVWDTRYPDGKDGQVYGGIDYRGSINSERTYVYTWAVSVAAPVGAADVEAATGRPGRDRAQAAAVQDRPALLLAANPHRLPVNHTLVWLTGSRPLRAGSEGRGRYAGAAGSFICL